MTRFPRIFTLMFFLCLTASGQGVSDLPESWKVLDIVPGRKFVFFHQWRAEEKFKARSAADQKFGFSAPDIAQGYQADLTKLEEIKKFPELKGCPIIFSGATISRLGGYGKEMGVEESRKVIPDKNKYEEFKKNIGGPFLGVLAPEWMDHAIKGACKKSFPQDNVFRFPDYPASKEEALMRLEAYFRHGIADLAYGDIISLEGYRLFHHQAFEWGAKLCIAEIGENIPATQVQIAFVRGAAREYGKPWGTWIADCSYIGKTMGHRFYHTTANHYGPGKELDSKTFGPLLGHLESLQRRFQYVSFMSGSNINTIECVGIGGYYKDDNSDEILELSPWGDLAKEMIAFGRLHQYDRGTAKTPVGIVVEWAHGWSPAGCTAHKIWGCLDFKTPDCMMDEVFNMFFPWNPACQFADFRHAPETAYLVNNEFGDVFDVITDHAKPEILKSYPILFLVGNVQIKGDFEKRLWNYVNDGGILVANIEQMKNAGMEWKIETNNESSECDSAIFENQKLDEMKFSCLKTSLKKGMTAELASADGNPLVIKQNIGKGQLNVSMVPWMLNAEGHAVKHIKPFLQSIIAKNFPFEIKGKLEVIYNKNDTGWVLTLVNNDGVDKKSKAGRGTIDYSKTQIAEICYRGKPVEIREWLANRSVCWKQEKGNAILQDIEILPGEFKIIEIKDK